MFCGIPIFQRSKKYRRWFSAHPYTCTERSQAVLLIAERTYFKVFYMKISVITLHTVNNYGSVLQTYATQRILEEMGHHVEIIDYWRQNNQLQARSEVLLQHEKLRPFRKVLKSPGISSLTEFLLKKKILWDRKPFDAFLSERVNLTKPYHSYGELEADPPEADVYITGSDQVWNSVWNDGVEKAYFLSFVPENKRRIAFSASIGRTALDDCETELMGSELKKYHRISMREESGVQLLKDRLGIESVLTLDPTLMLSGRQWRDLCPGPSPLKDPYILVYQLNANDRMDRYAEQLAEKYHYKILRLSYGRGNRQQKGKKWIRPSVEDFLRAFQHADCVVTDSFHATAFALNLGLNFISVPPDQFSVRMKDILTLTHTEFKMLTDYKDLSLIERKMDQASVQAILSEMRKTSMGYLEEALQEV